MPNVHITSLLRPLGRIQSLPETATNSATGSETIISNVELIPTFNFVVIKNNNNETPTSTETPPATTNSEEYATAQQNTTLCCNVDEENNASQKISLESDAFTEISSATTTSLVPATSTTATEDLLQQEINFSLTEVSSYFDEPTSSMSIEMEGVMEKTSTETNTGATGEETATYTTTAVTTTATSSSRSAREILTTSSNSAAEQSIEEEIEEIIEEVIDISEHDDDNDDDDNVMSSLSNSFEFSLDGAKALHSLHNSNEEEAEEPSKDVLTKRSTSDDEQFRIDDEQLSGGKLAQHFIVEEDDEDEEEEEEEYEGGQKDSSKDRTSSDDLDVSLPLEKALVHSKHTSDKPAASLDVSQQEEPGSPPQQSTTEDVSDLIEETDEKNNEVEASTSEDVELPMPDEATQTQTEKTVHSTMQYQTEKSGQSTTQNQVEISGQSAKQEETEKSAYSTKQDKTEVSAQSTTQEETEKSAQSTWQKQTEKFEQSRSQDQTAKSAQSTWQGQTEISAQSVTQAPSPDHSEKDHSLEEFVASNHSIEITLEDQDQSPLNPSDLISSAAKETAEKSSTLESQVASKKHPLVEDENIRMSEYKIVDHKTTERHETLEFAPIIENVTKVLQLPIATTAKPFTFSCSGEKKSTLPVPQDHIEDDIDDDEDDNSMELMKLRLVAMKNVPKEQQQSQQQQEISSENENSTEELVKPMERLPVNEFTKDVLEDITEESERNSISTAEEQQSLSMEKSGITAKTETSTMQDASVVSLQMLQKLEQEVSELQGAIASKDASLASLNLQLENATQRRGSNGAISVEQPEQSVSGRDTSSLMTSSTEYRTLQEDFGGATLDIYTELAKRDELITKLNDSLQHSLNVRENLEIQSDKLNQEVQQLRKQLTEAIEALRRPCWPRDQESNCGQRISEISIDLISESDDDLERQFLTDNEDKYSRNSRERQLSVPRQTQQEHPLVEVVDLTEGSLATFSKQMEQFQKYLTPSEVRLFFMVQKKFDDYLSQELEKCKMKVEQELKEKDAEITKLMTARQEKDNLHSKEMEDLRKYFETKCADLEKQFSDDVFSQKSQRHSGDTSSECSDQEQMPEELMPALEILSRSKESSPRKRSRAELLLSPSHRQMTPFSDNLMDDGKTSTAVADWKSFYQKKLNDMQHSHEEELRKLNEKLKTFESRYADDEYLPAKATHPIESTDNTQNAITQHVRDANTSLIIIDKDELSGDESQVIQKIIEEYERRLEEQLRLAREDIEHELLQQIQSLSETSTDDQHWPPALILLREKFTAKSQLEIAQLQMKHEEEMSRLKLEYERQLYRKSKRNATFDSLRDFEQLLSDRDGLRQLCKSLRHVLSKLAHFVFNCGEELNTTLAEEVQHALEQQQDYEAAINNSVPLFNVSFNDSTRHQRLMPVVHTLISVVEDPSLVEFISNRNNINENIIDFDLKECLDQLQAEADKLLQLSEGVKKRHSSNVSSDAERNESCGEAEDGLKSVQSTLHHAPTRKFLRTHSLNEQQMSTFGAKPLSPHQVLQSLPPYLKRLQTNSSDENSSPDGNASELNFQVHELRNRLIKSEADRVKLQSELEHTITRNAELGQELQTLRDQLSQLNSLNHIEFAEGYGLKSPQRLSEAEKTSTSFGQLQEKARNLLSSPTQKQNSIEGGADTTVLLLQMIEDFCREGDKVIETNKKEREDLQAQIDTADKQLKAMRQRLEEQAEDHEQEYREYQAETERLKSQLRDKEKEYSSHKKVSEEVEQLESQVRELTQKLNDTTTKRDKFEVELKASIDKIFVLREIISELETQVETKALHEHVLEDKIKQLEEFLEVQTRTSESLQIEVQNLKTAIAENYQQRIRHLEEKLQNMRPTAEQSMVLEQVVEQLRDIESTLDQKTKNLESMHNSLSSTSNPCSASEDVSVHCPQPMSLPTALVSPLQDSPMHPSPRQHSLTMEGVQRITEKLSKHSRVEEATVKRVRDLEMQVTHMKNAFVEIQHERDSLQERMTEQSQRISALQSRLEEQRQRAEELHRVGTADLNIRVHDLQMEVQNLRESLEARDKQIVVMKSQLEKSKEAIDRLEAELNIEKQPDRSLIERLESDLRKKNAEVYKLNEKIKNEMITKLALPDLMETMLADKNEEIDHLREQLDSKEKQLQSVLDSTEGSSVGGKPNDKSAGGKEDNSGKLSARTLSDILSITEFDEPEIVRRAVAFNLVTPLLLPENNDLERTLESSKEVEANLTHKRSDDLSGFGQAVYPFNTFDNPHYFQNPAALPDAEKTGTTLTPVLEPRQINFSTSTEDSKQKTSLMKDLTSDRKLIEKLKQEIKDLKQNIAILSEEKENEKVCNLKELRAVEDNLVAAQLRLGGLQDELDKKQEQITTLTAENACIEVLQVQLADKTKEIEDLLSSRAQLEKDCQSHTDLLTKSEKNLKNYQENEVNYTKRIKELEEKILKLTESEMEERESLRKELRSLSEIHKQCQSTVKDAETRKKEIEQLNNDIKAKDERIHLLATQLCTAERNVEEFQTRVNSLEQEIEKLRQQNSENSSKQYSVDEITRKVEKELNLSAQLDSNILKAIESEEENNLNTQQLEKQGTRVKAESQGTDDENFTGERELLTQLEALKAQVAVEREHCEELRQELLNEKQHCQELQEQDVTIIEAMRKRLETALEKEDELYKQLDMERERYDRVQTQLTALQRVESRRNSSLLLKSPTESPRRSPRMPSDFELELADRLRSEIKLLTAQNERERERCADLQRSNERERQRFHTELQERIDYCEKLKKEMEKMARDKENAEEECEHLRQRVTLLTQEIECLEARLATLQEAETRRSTRRERQQKETTQILTELQEVKTKLLAAETERDCLSKTITQLRHDVARSSQREAKMAEALANANSSDAAIVPQTFLTKMEEINAQLMENAQENRQMAETMHLVVEDRRQLQKKCQDLEVQLSNCGNVNELEERCNHLIGRYLRANSYRKALVYQKRYLKCSLQMYQEREMKALLSIHGPNLVESRRNNKRFKTVALAIVAIQRMKYLVHIWHSGKRVVSKTIFTITQQKRPQSSVVSSAAISSTSADQQLKSTQLQQQQQQAMPIPMIPQNSFSFNDHPLISPTLLNTWAATNSATTTMPASTSIHWRRLSAAQEQ